MTEWYNISIRLLVWMNYKIRRSDSFFLKNSNYMSFFKWKCKKKIVLSLVLQVLNHWNYICLFRLNIWVYFSFFWVSENMTPFSSCYHSRHCSMSKAIWFQSIDCIDCSTHWACNSILEHSWMLTGLQNHLCGSIYCLSSQFECNISWKSHLDSSISQCLNEKEYVSWATTTHTSHCIELSFSYLIG